MVLDSLSRRGVLDDLAKYFPHFGGIANGSLWPITPDSGHHSPSQGPTGGLLQDLGSLDVKDVGTVLELLKNTASGAPVEDKRYIMERVIQLASSLPSTSHNRTTITNTLLAQLWNDLSHPPVSYLGRDVIYRQADGSYNNIYWPQIGKAGSNYARSVQPKSIQPASRPDPGLLFDGLLARQQFKEHPNKLSSVLFYLAALIIHDLFRTDPRDGSRNMTSSYLDLSPLYGCNQEEQNQVRTFKDGKLRPDCFSERRIFGFPPGVGVLLIMFNRFHNYVVQNLAAINENNRFRKPDESDADACAKYDNDLFQTGRLITCGLYINIILKDYVRNILNINQTDSDWSLDPRSDVKELLSHKPVQEAGGNMVAAEFNLVYRWHSCLSDRDDRWMQEIFEKALDGKDLDTIGMPEFLGKIRKLQSSIPDDPMLRPFANLERQSNGSYDDNDLVKILTESIEDCAGSFGARHVPKVLRSVEILGILQARSWNLSSLNEFRKYFNLAPHTSFEDINSDPEVVEQLRHFYGHPDNVELYPGIVVEEGKPRIVPGSGLCASYTISRTVLSDAVALVRGDRFYTVDYTPQNLTNWGYNEANYDMTVNNGHIFHKLILRAFPRHFKPDSVYAHFPFVIPSENKKILSDLGLAEKYSWERPGAVPHPTVILSHGACNAILHNKEDFKITWGEKVKHLMARNSIPYGADFMLSGDEQVHEDSRQMMQKALYIEDWCGQVRAFYERITLELLHSKSHRISGVSQVDIVRDVANLAAIHFSSNIFLLPLKTEGLPHGVFTDTELYRSMALILNYIFYDVDPTQSFKLRERSRSDSQKLGELVMLNVQAISKTGFIGSIIDKLHGNEALANYGVHMIRRLLATQMPIDELVWTHILPTAGGMVANQAQLFSQCLDFYLSEQGSRHWPEIRRLAGLNTKEADDLLLRYFLEGARIRSTVALYRDVSKDCKVKDHGKEVNLHAGQRVICNLMSACKDPEVFPEPDEVDLTRDLNSYIHLGVGPHECLGKGMVQIGLTTMLKVVGRLDNLRRAPGPQGQLHSIPGPGGIPLYMSEDESEVSPFPATMKVLWDGELPPLPQ
uniref:Linoleate diol synthase n=1 Tax=Coccidioides posadasii RMSCC 3488 TaxID=454284 RepID=A0A0J6I166_COCPO|nr:linoleate diol synthase [Coccidioides posadasii RMSCC 3488]